MEKAKKQFINELEKGTQVDSVFMISKKLVKQKKSGQDYCLICLQDKGGSIDGIIWTEAFDRLSNADRLFKEGDFANIQGEVTDYKGSKQIAGDRNFAERISPRLLKVSFLIERPMSG